MRLIVGTVNFLSEAEVGAIHAGALRVLSTVGLCVENEALLRLLAEAGAEIDAARRRARFAPALVERFLAACERVDWAALTPGVSGSAGVYHSLYLDPDSDELLPWDEERLRRYFALARRLPQIGAASMLGCRLPVPPRLDPLYERLICWRYGAREGGSIHLDALCPYLYDLYQLRATLLGQPIQHLFQGAVYMIPSLKLGRHEASQVVYFWRRGLRVSIGDMHAMGATAPATLAGAVTLSLAEQLALGILQRCLWGERALTLGASIMPFDMRTAIHPFGRPELALTGLAMAQMARHYGLPFHGHAGLTDAKAPSAESGAQKALTALPILLAAGHVHLDAGLLSTDEVVSPLQLILDDELLSAMARLCQGISVTDDDLALAVIEAAGPGGLYLDQQHTARHHRGQFWEPHIWSRDKLGDWLESGRPLDADRARERYHALVDGPLPDSALDDDAEREIQALLARAAQDRALQG
jgi:trimethylamine--corrinoid protein Co-methyltransferase